jgi:hypothetical protein
MVSITVYGQPGYSQHLEHLVHRGQAIHANCPECNANRERRFVASGLWCYDHVREYLAYVRPRIAALRAGENSVDARIWLNKFRIALDRRITLKVAAPTGRKYADGYLDRLRMMGHVHDESYLKKFARKGASAL